MNLSEKVLRKCSEGKIKGKAIAKKLNDSDRQDLIEVADFLTSKWRSTTFDDSNFEFQIPDLLGGVLVAASYGAGYGISIGKQASYRINATFSELKKALLKLDDAQNYMQNYQ